MNVLLDMFSKNNRYVKHRTVINTRTKWHEFHPRHLIHVDPGIFAYFTVIHVKFDNTLSFAIVQQPFVLSGVVWQTTD